jgi:hypothetical protein
VRETSDMAMEAEGRTMRRRLAEPAGKTWTDPWSGLASLTLVLPYLRRAFRLTNDLSRSTVELKSGDHPGDLG